MHNIQSPRNDDVAIEHELAAKAVAPRVTLADLEANIASEHFFSAAEGYLGGALKGEGHLALPTEYAPPPAALNLLTFCVLVLRNGFTVTGESACASPENFDAEIGRTIARKNAVEKLWPLMGYELKTRLHNEAKILAAVKACEG